MGYRQLAAVTKMLQDGPSLGRWGGSEVPGNAPRFSLIARGVEGRATWWVFCIPGSAANRALVRLRKEVEHLDTGDRFQKNSGSEETLKCYVNRICKFALRESTAADASNQRILCNIA
ncbi:Protein of unknown function [Gryllus bimaculatus]|nr:Protein of unknown function [Gryllus bimaculatus]